jgi:hypothetical protein
MNANPHDSSPRQASQEANGNGTLRTGMEATARALFAADNAHVHEAMNSVHWERRGLLQRLTRGAPHQAPGMPRRNLLPD